MWTLVGSVLVNAAVGASMAVLPAFAELRGGPTAYGLLLAAISAGLLVGAISAPPLKRFSLSRLMIIGFTISGGAWLAALWMQWIPATVALFCLAWLPVGVTNVVFAAMRQTYVPEEILGRVSSVSFSTSVVAMPLGSLLGGLVGDAWGPAVVMTATGVGFLFVMLYWIAHPLLRQMPPIEEIDPSKYGLRTTRQTETVEHSSAIRNSSDWQECQLPESYRILILSSKL